MNLWEWFAADRMPQGDFPGYVAQMQYVRDALLRYGRVPLWCSECYGGTTNFTGQLKELAGFPLALWLGPLLATKALFALMKVLSALGLFSVVVRLFGAPLVGLVAGYAYGFGAIANYQNQHLDAAVAAALLPPIFLCSVLLLRCGGPGRALLLGALVACQLENNWVHAAPVPAAMLCLLAVRPWRECSGAWSPWRDRRLAARWAGLCALALAACTAFAGSHLALLASDARNHRLSAPATKALERAVYVEPSPFLFLNRDDALGPWLARHHPPGLEAATAVGGSRYLGGVVLAACLVGWLALRRNPRLSRWARVAALMLLLQYWLALGPRTLLWEVGCSLHWTPGAQQALGLVLRLAAALALAAGVALAARARRREETASWARSRLCAAAALLLAFPTFSLWKLLLRGFPLLEVQRSPGHYFDTAPFWLHLLFAIALVALGRRIARPRVAAALGVAVAVAVAVDYWPSRRSFSAGLEMQPLRRDAELVAELEGDSGTLRIVPSPTYSPLASWVAAQGRAGHAWGWLPWQSGRHWAEFLQAAAWRTAPSAQSGEAPRVVPDAALLATGRIRYFLLEAGAGPRALPEPWRLLRAGQRFSVWEQPDVAPMALAYGAYVWLAEEAAGAAAIAAAAQRENALVISAAGALAERGDLREGARVILAADGEPAPAATGEVAPSQRDWSERLRDPPVRSPVPVTLRREGPERIALEVPAAAAAGMVFVSEGYHPWWRATVDGEGAPVLRAQLAFLAVPVGPGRHTIELHLERPAAVSAARWISALAWLTFALAVPIAVFRRAVASARPPRRSPARTTQPPPSR